MTKQERNKVYITMLKLYEQVIKLKEFYGFCSLFRPTLVYNCIDYNLSGEELDLLELTNMIDLPELMRFKPEDKFYTWEGYKVVSPNQFWFPINDTETRINILKECIKLTSWV